MLRGPEVGWIPNTKPVPTPPYNKIFHDSPRITFWPEPGTVAWVPIELVIERLRFFDQIDEELYSFDHYFSGLLTCGGCRERVEEIIEVIEGGGSIEQPITICGRRLYDGRHRLCASVLAGVSMIKVWNCDYDNEAPYILNSSPMPHQVIRLRPIPGEHQSEVDEEDHWREYCRLETVPAGDGWLECLDWSFLDETGGRIFKTWQPMEVAEAGALRLIEEFRRMGTPMELVSITTEPPGADDDDEDDDDDDDDEETEEEIHRYFFGDD